MEIPCPSYSSSTTKPNLLYSLQAGLETDDLTVVTAKTGKRGLALVPKELPDVVILDVRLPDMSGLDVFDQIQEIDPRLPVIIITAFAATETAIEAMKRGAFEYLLKPVDLHQLREVVAQGDRAAADAVRAGRVRTSRTKPGGRPDRRPVARRMQEVYKAIGRIAPQDVTVLILGESGTGKELVARAHLPALAAGRTSRSWRSTAPPSRTRCWRANCSGTRRARSPGPTGSGSASSSRPTAARSSSTRSAT